GDFYIAPGATFRSVKTGTGSNAILSRGETTAGGTFTVDGTFIVGGFTPTVGMKNVILNGTVDYARSGNQTFLNGINNGQVPLEYSGLKISGSGTKTTLANAVTSLKENGSFEHPGAATFAIGTGGTWAV